MGKPRRWVARGVTILVAFAALALAIVYGGSAYVIRRDVAAPLPPITAATAPADIAEGGRLASLAGCTRCHGDMGQGQMLKDTAGLKRIIAPSLPRTAARATDGQLARAIRNGVGIDGRPLFGMPVAAFNRLADEDVARLIGFMRSLPTSAFDIVGETGIGVDERLAILTGGIRDSVTPAGGQAAKRPGDRGRYFARIACGQCHRFRADENAPGLEPDARVLSSWTPPSNPIAMLLMLERDERHARLEALRPAELSAIAQYLAYY